MSDTFAELLGMLLIIAIAILVMFGIACFFDFKISLGIFSIVVGILCIFAAYASFHYAERDTRACVKAGGEWVKEGCYTLTEFEYEE